MNDVKILGAGLSGLTAAITLRKAGKRVIVYEKGRNPSSRIIWGLQILKNYEYENGIDIVERIKRKFDVLIENYCKIFNFKIFSPSLERCEIYSSSPIYYLIERGFLSSTSLDMQLYKEARALGVEFQFGKSACKDAKIIARGPIRMDAVGAVASFRAFDKKNEIYLFYNNYYAPAGYIYLFRWGRKIEVGLAAPSLSLHSKPQTLLQRAISEIKILSEYLEECEMTGKPRFVYCDVDIPFSAYKKGKYYVGEAAGFLNASKGTGVYYAIASGYLAAKSIITGENYDKLWKKEFKKELVEGFKKRIVWQRMSNKDYDKMIRRLGSSLSIEEYMEGKKKTLKRYLMNLLYPYYLIKWKLFRRL